MAVLTACIEAGPAGEKLCQLSGGCPGYCSFPSCTTKREDRQNHLETTLSGWLAILSIASQLVNVVATDLYYNYAFHIHMNRSILRIIIHDSSFFLFCGPLVGLHEKKDCYKKVHA